MTGQGRRGRAGSEAGHGPVQGSCGPRSRRSGRPATPRWSAAPSAAWRAEVAGNRRVEVGGHQRAEVGGQPRPGIAASHSRQTSRPSAVSLEDMTSTASVATRIQVHPIEPAVLSQLRERDDARPSAPAAGRRRGREPAPLLPAPQPSGRTARARLLRAAAPLGAADRRRSRPYEELGPVFIHPAPCDGPAQPGFPPDSLGSTGTARLPGRWRDHERAAAGAAEASAAAAVETILAQLLDDPGRGDRARPGRGVGCFQFEVSRA